MSEIRDWFMQIPIITRAWFGLSLALPLLGRFGILNPYHMFLTSDAFRKLHLWRPFTSTFFYPLNGRTGFHFLTNLYFLYNYSKNLETGEFVGRPADYLFMLIFNWFVLVLTGLFMDIFLLMDPLILSVIYVWCQLNKELIVTFWFGTRFKAKYLPWVLFGFNMLLGGGGFYELVGIGVGHLYYYVKYVYPQTTGMELVSTPSILYRYLPSYSPTRSTLNSFPTASFVRNLRNQNQDSSGNSGSSSGYSWGRGQVLGGN